MSPVYFAFFIPIIAILALYFIPSLRKYIQWWELVLPVAVAAIFIFAAKAICIHMLTTDTEYLGGYVQQIRYYEPWNEYIHRTCTSCSGSGKTRHCHTYDCSYVKYHPEYWTAETTLGTKEISKEKHDRLMKKFGASPEFVEMNRHYHTIDGNMYRGLWKGDNPSLESVTVTRDYENRPQAATNVFHFSKVDTTDVKSYGLFEYPPIQDYFHQQAILGYTDKEAEHKLQILNARLGGKRHARVYICVFKDKDREAAHLQEQYWAGANKNELIICIGIDDQDKVQWAYDFSWSEREDVKVELRTFVEAQDKLNLSSIIDYTYSEMDTKWVPKDFHEFDYLTIEPTPTQVFWIMIGTMIVTCLCCWYAIGNEYENEEEFNNNKRFGY